MSICGIYKITNKLNNHSYIGLSVDIERRWKEHKKMKYRATIYDAFKNMELKILILQFLRNALKKN